MDQPTASPGSRIRSSIRRSVILMFIMIALVIRPPVTSAQTEVMLPSTVSIPTPHLELDLTTARVVVRVDSEYSPSVTARAALPEETASLSLVVDSSDSLVTRISRPHTDVEAPTVVVDINLSPNQTLGVIGTSLDLEITSTVGCQTTAEEGGTVRDSKPDFSGPHSKKGDHGSQTSPMSVTLTDSVFQGFCLPSLQLSAARGSNSLESVKGNLDFTLDETIVTIRNHQGQLVVVSTDSDLDLEKFDGSISLDLRGGSITGVEGSGRILGTAVNADVDLRSLTGSVQLTGNDSSIRVSDSSVSPIQITGANNRINLDTLTGSVNLNLQGGDFNGQDLQTRVNLRLADAAEGNVRSVEGDVVVVATGGSRFTISENTKHTRIQLDDSELDVSRIKSLELIARRSFTTGSDVRELSDIALDASEMVLSLPDLRGRPKIVANHGSYVRLEIPTPCSVVAKSKSSFVLDQFDVTGCNLVAPGARQRSVQPGADGRPPVRVFATVDDSSTVEVSGNL